MAPFHAKTLDAFQAPTLPAVPYWQNPVCQQQLEDYSLSFGGFLIPHRESLDVDVIFTNPLKYDQVEENAEMLAERFE